MQRRAVVDPDPGAVRCFLAVPLREPALSGAQHALSTLREQVPEVRWVRPETLHLTVHFFGSIPDESVRGAVDAVSPEAYATQPGSVTLDRLGSFPKRGWPRVLWLGCGREPVLLADLAERCRAALRAAGFETEDRRFSAHCTLGRPHVPWSNEGRAAWERARSADVEPATFSADRLVLYESRPGRGGSVYEVRETLLFAA